MMSKISFPLIALNFKVYREVLGEGAVKFAKIAEAVHREYNVCIAVAPPQIDLVRVTQSVGIPVFAQHVDSYPPGGYTGSAPVEDVKVAGAIGSIVNHSEKRLQLADIGAVLAKLRDAGLISILCTDTVETTRAGAALSPNILAVEPPELIGTGIPVSKARPEVVTGAVEAIAKINPGVHVLCGAGISVADDAARAIELGAEGVLLASAYIKAPDPKKLLSEMAEAALKSWEKRGR